MPSTDSLTRWLASLHAAALGRIVAAQAAVDAGLRERPNCTVPAHARTLRGSS